MRKTGIDKDSAQFFKIQFEMLSETELVENFKELRVLRTDFCAIKRSVKTWRGTLQCNPMLSSLKIPAAVVGDLNQVLPIWMK